MSTLSISYSSTLGAFGSQTVANDADESSDDEESVYTFEEALESWFFNKRPTTVKSYRARANNFIKWMKDSYNRPIDSRLKVKHVRLFFVHKKKSCRQIRSTVVTIKSLLVHLFKKKIIKKNIALSFESGRQLPPSCERTMSVATVKAFFREAQKMKDGSTLIALQLLAYGGLRRGVLSKLKKTDIKCTTLQQNGQIEKSYKIHVRNGKGSGPLGKSRYVPLKASIGEHIYNYAQGLNSIYLFPGKKPGSHLCANSIALRIKKIAKSDAVKQPQISCHFFRHWLATTLCHAKVDVATISKILGHSDLSVTSRYIHANNTQEASAMVDLTNEDGTDDSLKYSHVKIEKRNQKRKRKQSEKPKAKASKMAKSSKKGQIV